MLVDVLGAGGEGRDQDEEETLHFMEERRREEQHQSEPSSPSQSQPHPMPPWSAQLDVVVPTAATAGSRAVMDTVYCQGEDAQRGRLGTKEGKPQGS